MEKSKEEPAVEEKPVKENNSTFDFSKYPSFEENLSKPEEKPATPKFDVDDLVKRIDAKIAELEKKKRLKSPRKKKKVLNNQLLSNKLSQRKKNQK